MQPPWPAPRPAFASSWFGGSMTAYEWQNPRELAALQKYKLLLTGWMELLSITNYTNATAIGAAQAEHLKAAVGPATPVFSYQSAWLGALFYPEVAAVAGDPGCADFFLRGADGALLEDGTYCAQTGTTPAAHPSCSAYYWNWCNASAVDYYLNRVLQPLIAYPNGTARPYDGVFLDNSDGFSTHGSSNAHCDASNASLSVHIQTGRLFQRLRKWPIFSTTATGASDAREREALWAAGVGYTRFWEFFAPTAAAMASLYNETATGLPLLVHGPTHVKRHPGIPLNDSLAGFLVSTGGAPYAYFQYSSGWFDNDWTWSPMFDVHYGTATGPPTITTYGTNQTGQRWVRRFDTGIVVTADCAPVDVPSAWCQGSFAFPPQYFPPRR